MARASAPRLFLLCGLPGAGKTTFARRLAEDIPAVRFGPDEWMARLGFDLHDEGARERLERLFWQLAQDLLRLGTCVILEFGFWARAERDEKRLGARAVGAGVELHYLDVPIEELWRRIAQRNAESPFGSVPITREQLDSYLPFFEAPQRAELDLFDEPVISPTRI